MGLKKISGIAFPASRDGLTLFEVMLALVILLGSLAVLTQHMRVGAQAGVHGQLNTQAAMLAETKMAEVLSGAEPMAAVADVPLDTSGTGWSWSLAVGGGPVQDLLDLTVTVSHVDSLGNANASFSLRRYVRDPQVFVDAANATATTEEGF